MVLKVHSGKQQVSCHVKDTVLEHDPGGIIVKLHYTEYLIHLIHLIKVLWWNLLYPPLPCCKLQTK